MKPLILAFMLAPVAMGQPTINLDRANLRGIFCDGSSPKCNKPILPFIEKYDGKYVTPCDGRSHQPLFSEEDCNHFRSGKEPRAFDPFGPTSQRCDVNFGHAVRFYGGFYYCFDPWTTPEPVLDQHWEPLHPLVEVEDRLPILPWDVSYLMWSDDTNQRIASQLVRNKWNCVDVATRHTYTVICEKQP